MGLLSNCIIIAIVAVISSFYLRDFNRDAVMGKKVIITGASQNIGEELAYQYSKLGADIVITARREKELKLVTKIIEIIQGILYSENLTLHEFNAYNIIQVAKRCKELGAKNVNYIVADMSDQSIYESTIAAAVKILGNIDILVLNHVCSIYDDWEGNERDLEFLNRSMIVNYFSYVRMAWAARPYLQNTKGQLIVATSLAGSPGFPYVAGYGATKAAVTNFFTSLQAEAMIRNDANYTITICILGKINTIHPRWFAEKHPIKIYGHPIEDTVESMIRGAALRYRYVYVPWYTGYFPIIRQLFPTVVDRFVTFFVV